MAPRSDSAVHSVSVAGVIVDESDRVLLIRRRDTGCWEPPGGVVEVDETIPAALVREIREETGLVVAIDALTGVYKHMARGIVALVFRCHVTGGSTMRQTKETRDLRWVARSQLATRVDAPFAVRITDALDARPPRVRAHDGHTVRAG